MAKAKQHYYRIREASTPGSYEVCKFDRFLDPDVIYFVGPNDRGGLKCNCPSYKQPCKHIGYLEKFREEGEINGERIYDPLDNKFKLMSEIDT